ncbi:MAG TPA: acylneuraminate cytidylyltransferase family protein [Chitinophagaceae bacterium]|nr:acylneuraminate cytidylyltransferase family protein [Chitinophagaceae bacterium]
MRNLAVIPARSGSKGLLGKNFKLLAGKPLIAHTIEAAIDSNCFDQICISTNSPEVLEIARSYKIYPPFIRPEVYATDTATSEDVIKHALNYYSSVGTEFDTITLLQPTSPLRNANHIKSAFQLYQKDVEMLVSVFESDANPYYTLMELDYNGYLQTSKKGDFTRRQDCPKVWQLNGAIYIINVISLLEKGMMNLNRIPFEMSKESSIDIDDLLDFDFADFLLKKKFDK